MCIIKKLKQRLIEKYNTNTIFVGIKNCNNTLVIKTNMGSICLKITFGLHFKCRK